MGNGESFELRVKALIEAELQDGSLGLSSAHTKVYHRRGYWSKDREREIIVDVAIESCRPGESEPFLIWVWECKDYGSDAVPVDDLEEFHSKLEQLQQHRMKGTCITRKGFQSGAITYAKSKGISLARVLDPGRIRRITEEVGPADTIERGLEYPYEQSLFWDFYGVTSQGQPARSLGELLRLEVASTATT